MNEPVKELKMGAPVKTPDCTQNGGTAMNPGNAPHELPANGDSREPKTL